MHFHIKQKIKAPVKVQLACFLGQASFRNNYMEGETHQHQDFVANNSSASFNFKAVAWCHDFKDRKSFRQQPANISRE